MLTHKNGFTLIELLLSTGIISLASIGLYYSYHLASDWRKVNQAIYMPVGFNTFSTRDPYPVRVIIDLHQKYLHLYLM